LQIIAVHESALLGLPIGGFCNQPMSCIAGIGGCQCVFFDAVVIR
jgi:hypothetical protein